MSLRSYLSRLTVCASAFITLLSTSLSSQQEPKVLAPHKHALPALPFTGKWHSPTVERSMVGGLWMIDADFKSSIYLKNAVKVAAITVTPILYLSNGRRYQLADVTLEPAGTAVVSINQGLADKGIASWATLMGYVEIQYKRPCWDALCVTVRNVDTAHSLTFTYNLRPGTLPDPQSHTTARASGSAHLRECGGNRRRRGRLCLRFESLRTANACGRLLMLQPNDSQLIIAWKGLSNDLSTLS